jgi:signal transduction histidine kinase
MLFGGTLALALLAQLAYFRMQKWKTYTITHERERLAHDIHDTMAQSFAGVGYQIQGIRRRVVRGDRLDPTYLADQLRVAYQLVRNCHEEASRTIEMLGSGSPAIQVNLLGVLEQAARNITGDQIRIWTELNGNPPLLNLRLADALLHIGREAIVNAVSHSDPTLLTIRMSHERGSVELSVEDNGRGFDSTPEAAGFGIHGMKKRARDVGAVFQILSTPGHGTRVCVTARLHNETLLRRIFAKAEYRSRESSADDSAG